ncbi:hypothetical protein B6A10_05760 [Flavobacterium sp. L1I52]|uniref:YD repeat-containing protein n=1 Tax=Flavobacterium pokkalii TaxID=1940408 RepID=A0ABR7UP56_9FLAO|nr:hypothetical protein [Flavobacterium pokkalii]MBD0724679.1 hypothetical protein [Flavobacterium pokkalii]
MNIIVKYLLVTLLGFTSSFIQGQENNTNNIDKHLCKNNNIKCIKVFDFKLKNDTQTGDGHLLFQWKYNPKGLLIESVSSIPPLKKEIKNQYKYDSKEYLIEKTNFLFGTPSIEKSSYDINTSGQTIQKTEGLKTWLYTYNEKGNLIEEKWYYSGKNLSNKFFLDKYEYNNQNLITKMVRYRPDNTIFFYKTFEYDNNNNPTKISRFQNSRRTNIWIYKYDNQGNKIDEQYFEDGILTMWSKSKYDKKGLITEQKGRLNGAEEEYFRKYTYEYF